MSTAERDLRTLLITMKPALDPREWVYCAVDRSFPILETRPLFTFQENEGLTIVIERETADQRALEYQFACRRITLRVHSDLLAVGLLAAVSNELAKHGIPTNAVSAFYHDHLFVPVERGEDALRILEDLSATAARRALNGETL